MLHQPPTQPYCGLTIVVSQPSRLDKTELLTGNGGLFFAQECLRPDVTRFECDIRVRQDHSPLLPKTKCVLVLGQPAVHEWMSPEYNLNEHRGCPMVKDGVVHIASFLPQDAVDMQNYEAEHNILLKGTTEDKEKEDKKAAGKRHGNTDRKNFRFWLKKDTKKCIKVLEAGGIVPKNYPEARYHLYPGSDEVIYKLTNTKNGQLYIDIETDPELNILCFAFSFGLPDIYIVPVLDHTYGEAYGQLPQIFRVLAVAFRDNTTIAHNGASFDFFVFAHKYKLAVRKCYDTMIATHRCYPDVEKSLGHCVSLWTWEPFHKDEGNFNYMSMKQAEQLWKYCGKDVYTMVLIREAIDRHAKSIPGLTESIASANAAIRPYLTTMLQGMRYDKSKLDGMCSENDRLMEQYLRVMRVLTGPEVEPLISNQKCCRYFHEMLEYGVVKRTDTGAPSLAKDALFKLRLRYDNPVIDFLIAYRKRQKETGSLGFKAWKE